MRAIESVALALALLLAAGSSAAAQDAATVSGTLTYEGRSIKLTHLACASTSWPLVRMTFTTTPIPPEVLGNETAKHDFLHAKGAPRIDLAVKFAEGGPIYLMAGISDPASKVNPGVEPILAEPPPYTFEKKVVDDDRIAGKLATGGTVKTSPNEIPYAFDITFDLPRKACQ